MADLIQGVKIVVGASGTEVVPKLAEDFKKAEAASGKLGGTAGASLGSVKGGIQSVLGELAKLTGVTLGVAEAVHFLGDSFKAALEAQASVARVHAALGVIGRDTDEANRHSEELVQTLTKLSTFDDEQVRDALSNLVTITGNLDASMKVMKGTVDLAAARQMDLATASDLVGRAMEGNVGSLGRIGIHFSAASAKVFEYGSEIDRATVLQAKFDEVVGGRSAAALDTMQARLKIQQRSWGELKEQIGGVIVALGAAIYEWSRFKGNVAEHPWDANMAASVPDQFGPGRDEFARGNAVKEAQDRAKATELHTLAMKAAAEAAKAYGEALDALLGRGLAAEQSQHQLAAAIAVVDKRLGAGAGVTAYTAQLLALRDRAALTGATIRQDLIPAVEELTRRILEALPTIPEATRSLAEFMLALPTLNQLETSAGQIALKEPDWTKLQRAAEQAAKILEDSSAEWAHNFTEPVSSLFLDLASTGGQNFGKIAGEWFNASMKEGTDHLAELLSNAVLGAFGIQTTPTGGTDAERLQSAQNIAKQKNQLAQGIGAAIGGFQAISANQSGKASDLETIVSLTALGASIGNWVGAVIGFVVGVISAAFSVTGKDYKFGIGGINKRGQAFFMDLQNFNDQEVQQMIAASQKKFNDTYSGFAKILLQFPGKLLEDVVFQSMTHFQGAASANFMKHWQAWLEGTLPREIAEAFRPQLEKAFSSMGMTVARFGQVWDELSTLDPKEAQAILTNLADATVTFHQVFDELARVQAQVSGFNFTGGVQRAPGQSDFSADLHSKAKDLFDLAGFIVTLPLAEQAAAAKELSHSLLDVDRGLEAFRNGIERIRKTLAQQFADVRLRVALEQEPNPNKQSDLLEAEYQRIYGMIKDAAKLGLSPDDVAGLVQRGIDIASQIYSLGPTADAADWLNKRLDALKTVSDAALNALAQQATDEVSKLIGEMRPFLNYFLGLPVDIDAAMKMVVGSFEGFSSALDKLSARIAADAAANAPPPTGPPGGGGGPRHGGLETFGAQTVTNNVTVQVSVPPGSGADEIAHTAAREVIGAMRRNPRLTER